MKTRTQRFDFREPFKLVFERLAIFICNYSWQVCIVSFLINGLLGLGMLNLRTIELRNNDIDDLFIPRNNPTQKAADDLLKLFPDTSGHEFFAHQSVRQPLFGEILWWRRDGGNILEGTSHDHLTDVMQIINNITFLSANGRYVRFVDVCSQTDGECVIQGQEFIKLIQNNTNGEINMNQLYHRNGYRYESSLESVAEYVVNNRTLIMAKYLKLRYYLRHDTDTMVKDSKNWQQQFVKTLKDLQASTSHDDNAPNPLRFAFHHASSFYEELGNDTYPDIRYVSFVFIIFLVYIGFVTSGGNCLSKRMNVARMGYISVPVSILGAWGLLMACGVEFTNPVGVVPIYLIGQQIISTMISLSYLSDACGLVYAKERVIYVMRNSALPLTMMSLIHITSFAIGIASTYYVLKLVCIYFVVTLIFVYINHFVFFMSTVAIHEQRIDKGLHFCSCTKLRPREDLTEDGRNCCVVCCCSGEKPETRKDTESRIEGLSRKLMTQLLLTKPARVLCLLAFLAYTGVYIWGLVRYNVDALQESDVTTNSYFSDWQSHSAGRFGKEYIVQFAYVHSNDFTLDRQVIDDFKLILEAKEYVKADSYQSWYDHFQRSTHANISSESDLVQSINKTDFLLQNPVFRHDILVDNAGKRIVASRVYIQTRFIPSTKAIIEIIRDIKELVKDFNDKDKSSDDGKDKFIFHSPSFQLTDSHMLPLWEILKISSVQFGLLFTILLILNPNCIIPVQIAICYFSVVAGVFGMSFFFGAYLNPISMLSYLIASCYSVEVVGHTMYSIMNVTGTGRVARMCVVLSSVSQALFHPLFGQTIGLVVLVVCASYFFQSVFVIFITATSICVLHVLFFLPTLLSVLGPGDNVSENSVDFFQTGNRDKDKIHNWQHDTGSGLEQSDNYLNGAKNYGYQHDYL